MREVSNWVINKCFLLILLKHQFGKLSFSESGTQDFRGLRFLETFEAVLTDESWDDSEVDNLGYFSRYPWCEQRVAVDVVPQRAAPRLNDKPQQVNRHWIRYSSPSAVYSVPSKAKAAPYFADDERRNMIGMVMNRIPAIRFASTHMNFKIATS